MKRSAISVILFFLGCSSSLPIPTASDLLEHSNNGDVVTVEELKEDRSLYIAKCSGCHGLYLPSQYSGKEWQTILPMMNEKSRLSETEAIRIKRYIFLYSMH
ncbi:MAG: hypothetical protein M0R68_04260 [Bacteroidetes bacterium]|nr:hypothetical protein [Bacteroidota bacterium]